MLDEHSEQVPGRMIPYHAEVGRRDVDLYVPLPQRKPRGPWVVLLGLVFVLAAAGVGYGLGRSRMPPSVAPQAGAPVNDTAATVPEPLPKSMSRFVINEFKVAKRSVSSLKASVEPKVVEVPTTSSSDTVATPAHGSQRILLPEYPPAYLAPSVPPEHTLTELLYGQRLVAKTLVANYGWIVESGEIIDLRVDQVWNDPAQLSHGVYITFVAMAGGKGIRASGLLRYYGDGSEGNRYGVRDFMPSSVVRVGSW
jgi:hypothetical protein